MIRMVDVYGRWYEEPDYSVYPKEKWCDYDIMAAWIRECGYEPKTTMENIITKIFVMCDPEYWDVGETYTDGVKAFVGDSGGIAEFDYFL